MKYFMFCDFSTIKCDKYQIAQILTSNNINFVNRNNHLWELDVPKEFFTPFFGSSSEQISLLFDDFSTDETMLLVVKADDYWEFMKNPF